MRILHVIPAIAARYGGPSTAIRELTAAQVRCPGVEVELATTDADGAGGRISNEELATVSVPLHLFPRTLSERWKYSRSLGRWLREHVGGYDIVHVHALWTYATMAACRAATRANVPIVLRPCGMLSDYTLGRSAGTKWWYWTLVERKNLSSVSVFHATSQEEADEIRRQVGATAHVEVVPNGVESAAWTEPTRSTFLAEACGVNAQGKRIILFLSRLHPKKGVTEFLLPALAELGPDTILAIAGGPDDHAPGYEAEVLSSIDTLGLKNRVVLLGAVPPSQRWALLDGAHAFVLPSRSENFGIVVAEAMARGVPVVVTEGVQVADHVRASGAGEVVAPTIDAVTAGLRKVLACDRRDNRLAAQAREYARNSFDWDRIAGRIIEIYKGMVENQKLAAVSETA